jgi:transcriptional regulator with XRE-family HTH domain
MKEVTQAEIAKEIGVSEATVSRWISKKNIAPARTKGPSKFYSFTVLQDFKKEQEARADKAQPELSPTALLTQQIKMQQDLIADLKEQLKQEKQARKEDAERFQQQLNAKDRQLDNLTTLTTQVTKLTDQAQQLDLATKKQLEEPTKEKHQEPEKTAEKSEKSFFSRIFH